jgi:hypothetical protein
MNFLPLAIENPTAIGFVNGAPNREVVWHVSPLAPGSEAVEYGIDYFPLQSGRFTTPWRLADFEHCLLKDSPFGISQIRIVLLTHHKKSPEKVDSLRITIYESKY